MKVEFRSSFARDLQKIKAKKLRLQVKEIIEHVERAESTQQIENFKKIRGTTNFFRIKMGDYRIGLILETDTIIFVRFLHRKDIYRYFP